MALFTGPFAVYTLREKAKQLFCQGKGNHMHYLIPKEELRITETIFKFQGEEYGGVAGSFFWVFTLPGRGSKLHKHPYQEVFVLQEGWVTFTIGETTLDVCGAMWSLPRSIPPISTPTREQSRFR